MTELFDVRRTRLQSKESKNEERYGSAFPFQTAKTIISNKLNCKDSIGDQKLNNDTFQNQSVKFTFQKAGCILQRNEGLSKCEDNINSADGLDCFDKINDVNTDHEIPFSEDQIKEFGLISGFQTAKNEEPKRYIHRLLPVATQNEPADFLLVQKNQVPESPNTTVPQCDDLDVLTDINKIMSKYDSKKPDGPKKILVFNKKKGLRSNSSKPEGFSSPSDSIISLSDTVADFSEKCDVTPNSGNNKDTKKIKVEFGSKLRSSSKPMLNGDTILPETKYQMELADSDNSIEPVGNVKKRKAVFSKSQKEDRKNNSVTQAEVTNETHIEIVETPELCQGTEENTKVNNDTTQSSCKRKLSFSSSTAKRRQKKVSLRDDPDVVFKVPDTEEYMKVKLKTRKSAADEKKQNAPIKPVFKRPSKSTQQNTTSQMKSNTSNVRSNSKQTSVIRDQTSGNAIRNLPSRKSTFGYSKPLDPKKELAELDSQSPCGTIYKDGLFKKKRHVILPSATSVCVPANFQQKEFRMKSKKVKRTEDSEVYRGPPIKVAKRLPDLIGVRTRAGQQILVNLNETRPLLFQNKAAAEWWDAATYTNFLRMRHQLEHGEYLHPDLSRTIEDNFQEYLSLVEASVTSHVRQMDTRTLLEKYILCQWEEDLVKISGNIDQWLDESFDMSPIALSELSRDFDRLLNIPVTFVMIKKTVYLVELYWNISKLSKGVWSRILSQKASAILKYLRESFHLSRWLSRDHYQSALYDLVAQFREDVMNMPHHQRVLITHTMNEEQSWPQREVLLLTTKPDVDENSYDTYEFTENDHKNLFMLKLLLVFNNQIPEPIFLPRNRALKEKRTRGPPNSTGLIIVSENEFGFPTMGEEPYDYYDEWNFRTKPKRIDRSGKNGKYESCSRSTSNNEEYDLLDKFETFRSASEPPSSVQKRQYNKLDTFDYEEKETSSDRLLEVTKCNDLLNIDQSLDETLMKYMQEPASYGHIIKQEHELEEQNMEEIHENGLVRNKYIFPDFQRSHNTFQEEPMNISYQIDENIDLHDVVVNSSTPVNSKISDLLVDTLKLLSGDLNDTIEMDDDYVTHNELTHLPHVAFKEEMSDQYIDETLENNVDFDSEEIKLIYDILDTSNIAGTDSSTIIEGKPINNDEDIYENGLVNNKYIFPDFQRSHNTFQEEPMNISYQIDENIDLHDVVVNSSTPVNSKISDLLVDTLKLLSGDLNDTIEMDDDYVTHNELTHLPHVAFKEEMSDQYIDETLENNVDFDSEEIKLIYDILDTSNIAGTDSSTIIEGKPINNDEDIYENGLVNNKYIFPDFQKSHNTFQEEPINISYQIDENIDLHDVVVNSSTPVDGNSNNSKITDLLVDTLKLLSGDLNDTIEMDNDYVTHNGLSHLPHMAFKEEMNDQYIDETLENNVDFDSEEIKLIYDILDSSDIEGTETSTIIEEKPINNNEHIYENGLVNNKYIFPDFQKSHNTFQEEPMNISYQIDENIDPHDVLVNSSTPVDVNSNHAKISDLLVDTLKLLSGDLIDTIEIDDDYVTHNELSHLPHMAFKEEMSDQYIDETLENNVDFDSEEINLIYDILDTSNIEGTETSTIIEEKLLDNNPTNCADDLTIEFNPETKAQNEDETFLNKVDDNIEACVLHVDDMKLYDKAITHEFDDINTNMSKSDIDNLHTEENSLKDINNNEVIETQVFDKPDFRSLKVRKWSSLSDEKVENNTGIHKEENRTNEIHFIKEKKNLGHSIVANNINNIETKLDQNMNTTEQKNNNTNLGSSNLTELYDLELEKFKDSTVNVEHSTLNIVDINNNEPEDIPTLLNTVNNEEQETKPVFIDANNNNLDEITQDLNYIKPILEIETDIYDRVKKRRLANKSKVQNPVTVKTKATYVTNVNGVMRRMDNSKNKQHLVKHRIQDKISSQDRVVPDIDADMNLECEDQNMVPL